MRRLRGMRMIPYSSCILYTLRGGGKDITNKDTFGGNSWILEFFLNLSFLILPGITKFGFISRNVNKYFCKCQLILEWLKRHVMSHYKMGKISIWIKKYEKSQSVVKYVNFERYSGKITKQSIVSTVKSCVKTHQILLVSHSVDLDSLDSAWKAWIIFQSALKGQHCQKQLLHPSRSSKI